MTLSTVLTAMYLILYIICVLWFTFFTIVILFQFIFNFDSGLSNQIKLLLLLN